MIDLDDVKRPVVDGYLLVRHGGAVHAFPEDVDIERMLLNLHVIKAAKDRAAELGF